MALQFTKYVKTPNAQTVYGVTSDGRYIAFESGQQFLDSGGNWNNIQTVNSVPQSIPFSQAQSLSVTTAKPTQTISGVTTAQPTQTISGVTTAPKQTISGVSSTPVGTNYNPQQTSTTPIQGSSPTIQGSNVNPQPAGTYSGQGGQTFTLGDGNTYDINGNLVSSGSKTGAGGTAGGGSVPATAAAQSSAPPPGVDPALWNQLDPASQAFFDSLNTLAKSTYDQGAANFSINAKTLQDALTSAQNDPDIKAKYGDAAVIGAADLQNNLGYINAEYNQNYNLVTAEQAKARKDLTESEAAAGRAYSGFRNQAQNLLKSEQSGIIESSKRTLQQQVRQAGSAYETTFGSAALGKVGPITAGGETYTPLGGITGSAPLAQKGDVQAKQQEIYNAEKSPLT